jgi:2,3-bisphosphoglycerate-dependent phosphoglycerate mutase
MLELLLIRHGQSEADLLDVHEGRADFPLTGLGRRQAGLLAELSLNTILLISSGQVR